MDKLKLSVQTMMYRCPYGNHLGVVSFLWKIPEGMVDQTRVSQAITKLNENHRLYASREMRKEFLDRYHKFTNVNKSVLRNIYKNLMGDCSAGSTEIENAVDERVAEALFQLEIIYDMRKLNGKPKSSKFDAFWDELRVFVEELTPAVDERRHSDTPHLPVAISLHHLQQSIKERLEKKSPGAEVHVPSVEWLRLQFWPQNPYSTSALRHTGRLNLKFGVQVRQLRHAHVDSKYVSMILRYLKEFAVEARSFVNYVSIDDKAVIPIGEPGLPVSTGVRGHNRSIVLADGPGPSALDHDFHIHGIVPSVSFVVDIPQSPKDSFYRGKVFVCLKDKITQASSPLRHSTELAKLLKAHCHSDAAVPSKSVLVVVSDGGPDHRITYAFVKVALICLFISLDLDMLVARTCPYQSWQNVAERVMSTLNLALMNVSLARKKLPEELESLIRNKKTMAEVRQVIAANPVVGVALQDSLQQVLCTLAGRFTSMEIKEEKVQVEVAATKNELQQCFNLIHCIESTLSPDNITKETLAGTEHLQTFIATHCSSTAYLFQVKKCLDPRCGYCRFHPVRMPVEDFQKISFVPLPLITVGEKYADFKDLYGKAVDERDRPSSKPASPGEEVDKKRKDIIVSSKVRCVLTCQECFKPRCVYSKSKLTCEGKSAIEELQDSRLYTCGSSLFPPESPVSNTICVRESLTCSSPMELSYYSSTLVHFLPVCYWCGLDPSKRPRLC